MLNFANPGLRFRTALKRVLAQGLRQAVGGGRETRSTMNSVSGRSKQGMLDYEVTQETSESFPQSMDFLSEIDEPRIQRSFDKYFSQKQLTIFW